VNGRPPWICRMLVTSPAFQLPEIPSVCPSRGGLPVGSATMWSVNCTRRIHGHDANDLGMVPPTWDPHSRIHRRWLLRNGGPPSLLTQIQQSGISGRHTGNGANASPQGVFNRRSASHSPTPDSICADSPFALRKNVSCLCADASRT